jgi:hypothetical protein
MAQTQQTSNSFRQGTEERVKWWDPTHYRVSGGPMMVTCHSNTLLSSTSREPIHRVLGEICVNHHTTNQPKVSQPNNPQKGKKSSGNRCTGTPAGRTSELLLQEEARLAGGGRHDKDRWMG